MVLLTSPVTRTPVYVNAALLIEILDPPPPHGQLWQDFVSE